MPAEADRTENGRPQRRRARPSGVFISYRREDASGFAGRLHGSLSRHFGPRRVFRDVDTIEPGEHFPEVISRSLSVCGAFVVVIGREWVVDLSGRRRLDDPTDWVRVEMEAALARPEVLMVPVLVEGAAMPSKADLPETLHPLLARHALEVTDPRWDYDVTRLTKVLEGAVGQPSTWPGRLRRAVIPNSAFGAIARLVVASVVVLGMVVGVLPRLGATARTEPMGRGYNIAVAEFESVDASGDPVRSPAATALAQEVFSFLSREVVAISPTGFELRPPVQTGRIQGTTAERRARAAEAESKRINADVIVYGTLRMEVPQEFVPEFFLSDRLLPKAEELFGQHDLGSAIQADGDIVRNPRFGDKVREQILGRARALAEFLVGLSYVGADEPVEALAHFEKARTTEGWDDRDGKEVLYLFMGNAAGRTAAPDHLDRADSFYQDALDLNPEYARAQVGRAEVLLHKAKGTGNCEAGTVDADGLKAALDGYQTALSAQVQPALSDIPTKVAFGKGRVYLCLSQALVGDYWGAAEGKFNAVVTEFRSGNTRVQEIAGESYAGLGFVHLPVAGAADARDRYLVAAADYQSAIEFIGGDLRNERKAYFSSMRGFIFARLGDLAQADEAYRLALSLSTDPAAKAEYERALQSLAPPA